jgi:putative Ca2+/H+ antiporter (TMEM165/GDT1 family)
MNIILTSTALVALAEMGDKTQLLAILLATRFRKPLPIILGILVATLANHFLAALVGLAYSGGLDTSVILKWLQTEYGNARS